MLRPFRLVWFAFGVVACDGHRDIRLFEPEESLLGGAGTTGLATSGGAAGAASLLPAGSAGTDGTAVVLPNPRILFKNLLILKTSAQLGDQAWEFSSEQVANLSTAFRVTFPALISEFTAGTVVFDNYVTVSDEPVTSVGYNNDMVEPENVPGWELLVGPSGSYDCVYVVTPRPQQSAYARGDLASNPTVAWISDGPQTDLTTKGYAMSAWLFGWLAEMGPTFYAKRLGLDHVPTINSSDQYGYARNQDGLKDFLAWYRDYLTRNVVYNGYSWGLGEPAWALGTLREWASTQ